MRQIILCQDVYLWIQVWDGNIDTRVQKYGNKISENNKMIHIWLNNAQMTHQKVVPQIQSKCNVLSSTIDPHHNQQNYKYHFTQFYEEDRKTILDLTSDHICVHLYALFLDY